MVDDGGDVADGDVAVLIHIGVLCVKSQYSAAQQVIDEGRRVADGDEAILVHVARQGGGRNGHCALSVIERNLFAHQIREHDIAQGDDSGTGKGVSCGDVHRHQRSAGAAIGFELERVGQQTQGTVGLCDDRQRVAAVLAGGQFEVGCRQPLGQIQVALEGGIDRLVLQEDAHRQCHPFLNREIIDIKSIHCSGTHRHRNPHHQKQYPLHHHLLKLENKNGNVIN